MDAKESIKALLEGLEEGNEIVVQLTHDMAMIVQYIVLQGHMATVKPWGTDGDEFHISMHTLEEFN